MRGDVIFWACAALLLMAAEAVVPGAFMLWLGIAAGVVWLLVLLFPDLSVLAQSITFVVLGFIAIQVYRTWFRKLEPESDQPALNRRTQQLVGRVVVLQSPIERGTGRVQIADAFWEVNGPDLPAGASVRIVGADGMTLRVVPVD